MVIDIVSAEAFTGKFLQVEVFFVRRVIRAYDAELAIASFDLAELLGDCGKGFRPGGWLEHSFDPDHGRLQTLFMIGEVESVAAFDAEKFAIETGAVAIVAA